MMFFNVRCLIIYCVPIGAAANLSWDANTVLTCGKTNRTVSNGQSFIFLSSNNASHSHPDAASTIGRSSTCDSTQNPGRGREDPATGFWTGEAAAKAYFTRRAPSLSSHCLSHSTHERDASRPAMSPLSRPARRRRSGSGQGGYPSSPGTGNMDKLMRR
jgi:hypothetical protein